MWQDIENMMNDLEKTLSLYKEYCKDYAKKEYNYKTELSKRLVQLRAEGQPVTHLADIVRGEEKVAQLRMERDIAEGLKKSAEEGINFYKLKIRMYESQLNREWGSAK